MVPGDVFDLSSPYELERAIYSARGLYRRLCFTPTCKSDWIISLAPETAPYITLTGSGRYLVILRPGRGFLFFDVTTHHSWEKSVDPWPPVGNLLGGMEATEITRGSQHGIAIALFLA